MNKQNNPAGGLVTILRAVMSKERKGQSAKDAWIGILELDPVIFLYY